MPGVRNTCSYIFNLFKVGYFKFLLMISFILSCPALHTEQLIMLPKFHAWLCRGQRHFARHWGGHSKITMTLTNHARNEWMGDKTWRQKKQTYIALWYVNIHQLLQIIHLHYPLLIENKSGLKSNGQSAESAPWIQPIWICNHCPIDFYFAHHTYLLAVQIESGTSNDNFFLPCDTPIDEGSLDQSR